MIRAVELSDSDALSELMTQLGYPTSDKEMRRRVALIARQPDYHTFVALDGAEIVGMANVYVAHALEMEEAYGQLALLVVHDGARRRGVGKQLVEYGERWLLGRGATRVVLTSGTRRTEAHEFYRAVGYEQTGLRFAKRL